MNTSHARSVAVVGAGTMGSGIAVSLALAGIDVMLIDRTQGEIERSGHRIDRMLSRATETGNATETEATTARATIVPETNLDASQGADIIIEAVYEDWATKSELIRTLDGVSPKAQVVASNTSSYSITALGSQSFRPDRVVGMHFFNPVLVMPLVEVVRGLRSSDAAVEQTRQLALDIGKSPVIVDDSPGFVVNRLLIPMVNEAIFILEHGLASADEIDRSMKLGAGHPLGPLALGDMIGLDVCLAILEVLHQELGEDKYRPAPLLRRMVNAGRLGKKTGHGFYHYD